MNVCSAFKNFYRLFFYFFCKKYKSCIFIKLSIRCVVMKKTNFQKCTWSSMYVEIITVKKLACLHGIPIMTGQSMKLNRDSAMVKALLRRNPLVSASLAEYPGQHREKQPIKCIFDQGKIFPLKRSNVRQVREVFPRPNAATKSIKIYINQAG